MGSLKQLISVVQKFNLIESTNDIDFLFLYFYFNKEESLNKVIVEALEWGYNNDELEDFFLEHWDILVNTELVTNVNNCSIIDHNMYLTTITLSRFNSQNKYYYRIDASGVNEDMFDTNGFYSIKENEDDENIISIFQQECLEAYTCHGEFTEEEMIENSSIIEFSD